MAAFLPHTLQNGRSMAPEAFAGLVQPVARLAAPSRPQQRRAVRASATPPADQAQMASNGLAQAQPAMLSTPNQEGLNGLAVSGTAGLQTVRASVNLGPSTWFSVGVSCDVPFEILLTWPEWWFGLVPAGPLHRLCLYAGDLCSGADSRPAESRQ